MENIVNLEININKCRRSCEYGKDFCKFRTDLFMKSNEDFISLLKKNLPEFLDKEKQIRKKFVIFSKKKQQQQ